MKAKGWTKNELCEMKSKNGTEGGEEGVRGREGFGIWKRIWRGKRRGAGDTRGAFG